MMPGSFYVRAFIKQYAEAVNLEPEELFEQYKSEIPTTLNDDIPEKLSRVQSRKNISSNNSKFFDILPKILVVAFVVVALVVVWYFWSINASKETNEPVDNNTEETTFEQSENLSREEIEKEEPVEEEAPASGLDEEEEEPVDSEEEPINGLELEAVESNGKETVYELRNAEKFELKVVSTGGQTWVNILNGKGYSFFQGMLEEGGTTEEHIEDFTNEEEAVIVIGNSTNTAIYVNDQLVEYVTPPTDQVRQDITVRYIKATE